MMSNKTKKQDLPKPPGHLSTTTRTWWNTIVEAYVLESHHLHLLQAAGENWDRAQAARAIIDKSGMTYENRFGEVRPRPECAIQRDSTATFMRALRELGLDLPPNTEPHPPEVAGRQTLEHEHA